MNQLRIVISSLSALLVTQTAFSAAFQLYELGTPVIGTAGVGQAAIANDASTAYFNPAGMVALPASQFMVGSQLVVPYTQFDIDNDQNTVPGSNGGEAAVLTPGLGLYYVYSFSQKLKLGISLTAPYGGFLNYNNGWVGRYNVINNEFYTLNLNPSVAYQVSHWLSIGAGVAVEYANLYQTVALPLPIHAGNFRFDAEANVKVHDTNVGYNIGLLLTPYRSTKIGIAYRSQIIHELNGTLTFADINPIPNTTTKMIMPQNVIVSLDQALSNRFNLLLEAGWANWSTMHSAVVNVGDLTATTILDWKDTYRVGLGGQYKVLQNLIVQAGAAYDSSPTSASHRTPDLPMDRQIRAGLGVLYNIKTIAELGLSYEYINFGDAAIHNVSRNNTGTLAGSYWKNWGNVLQASINVNL